MQHEKQRIALLIGNDAYNDSPLRNPVNDARDLGEVLGHLGFMVSVVANADLRAMKQAVETFRLKAGPDSVALFYFSGHGLEHEGKNYLVPLKAEFQEYDVDSNTFPVESLLRALEDQESFLSIVILDACRNSPYKRGFRAVSSGGLAPVQATASTLIAYSTAPGKTALDGVKNSRNSPYVKHLLKHIPTEGASIQSVLMHVRRGVVDEARLVGTTQVPWETSSMFEEFYFKPLRAPTTVPVPHPQPSNVANTTAMLGSSQVYVATSGLWHGSPCFTTIRDAVEKSDASVINVMPGVYHGHAVLDRAVVIQGVQDGKVKGDVMLTSEDGEPVLAIRTSSRNQVVTVKNVSVTQKSKCVAIAVAYGSAVLDQVIVVSADDGVEAGGNMVGAVDLKMRHCNVTRCGSIGLYVKASRASVSECVFDRNWMGVEVEGKGSDVNLRSCTVSASTKYGVGFRDSSLGKVEGCEITKNGEAGIRVELGANPVVRDNKVHDGDGWGILVRWNGQGTFKRNDVRRNAKGPEST